MGPLRRVLIPRLLLKRHGCVMAWCIVLVALGPAGPSPHSGLLVLASVWFLLTVLRYRLNPTSTSNLSHVSAQMAMGIAMGICWAAQAMCMSNGTPHLFMHMLLMMSLPAMMQWGLQWMRPLYSHLLGLVLLIAAFTAASIQHLSVAVSLSLAAWAILSQVTRASRAQSRAIQFIGPMLLALTSILEIDLERALSLGLGLAVVVGLTSLRSVQESPSDPLDQSPHGLHPEDAKG